MERREYLRDEILNKRLNELCAFLQLLQWISCEADENEIKEAPSMEGEKK